MIVTLTLNPSLDRTLELPRLGRGEVNRATAVHLDPGGKGINVARALAVHGVKARAVVALGGPEGRRLADLLADVEVEVTEVAVAGASRSNVTVVEPDGTTTKLNEPGAALRPDEVVAVLDATVAACAGAEWLVASGSLPPGVPDDVYADLAARLASSGTRVAVDTSGRALSAALGGRPALVKPNLEELAECTGESLTTLGAAAAACRSVISRGARAVLASLGSAGALLVQPDGEWFAHARPTVLAGSVGAGDALLAGFIAAGGSGPQALVEGVAWGTAAVGLPGSAMPSPADLRRGDVVLHHAPPHDLPLTGTG